MKIFTVILTAGAFFAGDVLADKWVKTASGEGDSIDASKYATALISNGGISTVIDNLGTQRQKKYSHIIPSVAWAGRRYGMPGDTLIPMGWFDTALSVDGKPQNAPLKWSQTLNVREAYSENTVEYADACVKTFAFVPMGCDMLVVKKTVIPKTDAAVLLTFLYSFAPQTREKPLDRVDSRPSALADRAVFAYKACGLDVYRGEISVIPSVKTKIEFDQNGTRALLGYSAKVSPDKPLEAVYFITYDDDFDKNDFAKSSEGKRAEISVGGFDKIFSTHKTAWAKFWSGTDLSVPNEKIENMYYTGLYHQRGNATKWSLPVGIFSGSHWGGRFFGWDEAFNALALASSGKFDISRRPADFRRTILKTAMSRASKGEPKPLQFGANYTWQTYETKFAKLEASTPGYWLEHIFHMSNIALEAWTQYLYTNDKKFLEETAYPVISECAAYYYSHWLYRDEKNRLIVGRCTDLERMGPCKLNPFMTSCGIIYNFETAARAAEILGKDSDFAQKLREAAAELRKSLPNDGEKFVPYENSKDKSINVIGGLFPYPVFDETDAMQKNAVYDFFKNIREAGNMYTVGSGVNAWYAGWTTAALVAYSDKQTPEKLLNVAAETAGAFGDMFEINEPGHQYHPWFSTASGNIIYAVNLMMLRCTERGEIFIAPSVPETWKNYSYTLPCFGDLKMKVRVENGKLVEAELSAGALADSPSERTVIIPSAIADKSKIIGEYSENGGAFRIVAEAGKPFYAK